MTWQHRHDQYECADPRHTVTGQQYLAWRATLKRPAGNVIDKPAHDPIVLYAHAGGGWSTGLMRGLLKDVWDDETAP